jgi:rare lipoprotein A
MPIRRIGRHIATIGLLIGGAAALLGCQQLDQPTPLATTPKAPVVSAAAPSFQVLGTRPVAPMAAASTTGQFEELVKPTPVPTAQPTVAPTAQPTPQPEPEPAAAKLYESGIASTYGEGDGFEGNRTACGQIFHTSVPQVAHKSLPCGTKVRVEDASSGRSVVAEVTDRGPYVKGRIVDLSWGAFKQLEPSSPGLLRVNVYLVGDE